MTREEARADLMLAQADISYRPKDESIDMAIEALKNQKSIIEELETIKADFEEIKGQRYNPYNNKTEYSVSMKELREVFDNHIAELKEESKDCVDCGNNCDNGCCKKGCIVYCEGRYWKPKGENNGR